MLLDESGLCRVAALEDSQVIAETIGKDPSLVVVRIDAARPDELIRYLHRRFQDRRLMSDWFALLPTEIAAIRDVVQNVGLRRLFGPMDLVVPRRRPAVP